MDKKVTKAQFMASYIKGKEVADFGSEDNYGSIVHTSMEKALGRKILRVDKYGQPNIRIDFNYTLPFLDNTFDTIIISEVIEHIQNVPAFLRECGRLLKPKGIMIITTPNLAGLYSFSLLSLISKIEHDEIYNTDIYGWNKHTLWGLIEFSGLQVKKFKYISFYWKRNYAYRLIAHLIPQLRPTLFFIVEKRI